MSENRTETFENTTIEPSYVVTATQARLERRLNFDLPRIYFQENIDGALSGLILQFLDITKPQVATAIREGKLTKIHTKPVEDFDKLARKTTEKLWVLAVDYSKTDPKYFKNKGFETVIGIIEHYDQEKAEVLRMLSGNIGNTRPISSTPVEG